MVLLDLAGFDVAVDPTVDGLEGDPEPLGQLDLAKLVFQPVGVQRLDQIFRHGSNPRI